ncbi:GNAT family N-acetyltransferase [Sporosarcina sp. USHLN248]|uniref:GNAT family N-acetyltransferase n=1 Tax=Sporosarcina sp. USHLN248 TaxID=3081300 RepID=UPI003015B2DC
MAMKFYRYEDAEQFALKAEPIVEMQEDVFSLFYGVLQAIKAGKYADPFMATVEKDGQVVALLQMTRPHPLNLIIVDEENVERITEFIAVQLLMNAVEVPSVISLKPWAFSFAQQWERKTGKSHSVLMDQGIYRLDEVNESLEASPGNWRYAEEKDIPLIEKWFSLFEQDTNLPQSPESIVKERVATFVKEREVFLFEDGKKTVSMMKKSRPTKHSVTVSLVFTPKEERKKGYARTMVAAGSKELLKEFDYCVLYTDMLNPTSNKIYMEIGYRRIADSVHIGFH